MNAIRVIPVDLQGHVAHARLDVVGREKDLHRK
jgi:hypothetical protein